MRKMPTKMRLIEVVAFATMLVATSVLPLSAMPGAAAMQSAMEIATTQLTDTVYRADGTTATGTVLVSWPAFSTAAGLSVAAGSTSATISTGGLLSLALAPNAGSNPMGSYYTAIYHLDDGTVTREYWVVPVSAAAVTISSIKSTVLPASVALQTVTKSYVDTQIANAVTGGTSSTFVMKAGDTMTGPLVLPADPVSASQAADKHYVDVSVAAVGGGSGGKVALLPTASQTVTQPAGTELEVSRLNGVEYASQYATAGAPNGIANATTSTDCTAGCEVKADTSYVSPEILRPIQWASQTHVEDTRKGGRWDGYINPENTQSPGVESGQAIDVVSTRSGAVVHQLAGTNNPASIGLAVTNEAPAGGSNLFPQSIDTSVPYFKSGYSALTVGGTYNTQGQHVLVPRLIDCYGVGDCLAGSEYLVSSGGFRDEADEGTHPMDIQVTEDPLVFTGTCATGCSTGSTAVSVTVATGAGTQGDGRFLINKSPAKVISAGSLVSGSLATPHASAVFTGTSFALSTFFAVNQAILSQATDVAPGTVTVAIATAGAPTGYATATTSAPASTGMACVADEGNGFLPSNYEMAAYTVVDATHLQMTFKKAHALLATIAIGGLCGYGLEQTVDTTAGIRQVFPVVGSYSATGLYYAGTSSAIVGQQGTTSAFVNVNLPVTTLARSGNVVTLNTSGVMPLDLNGLAVTVSGAADSSYNGTFAATTTGASSLAYPQTGANSASTGGALTFKNGGFALYPMAEVLSVFDATAKSVDGLMTLAPNNVAWSVGDAVEEPHFFQQQIAADTSYVTQTTPRPTTYTRAGITYQGNNGPGLQGWAINNSTPASNYAGNGGTHTAPDFAYQASGVWKRTVYLEAGEQSAITVNCNSHGCGKWNSNFNLFELQSSAGTDTVQWQPPTSTMAFSLRGTPYSFSPTAFTAGTVNATTLNGALNASNLTGTIAPAELPVFGASGVTHAVGAVPDPGATAGATRYLREDGTWSAPAGGGGGGSGGISATPIASQSIAQPAGTTLSVNSLGNVLDPTLFAGADLGAQINTAMAALPLVPAVDGDTAQHCGVISIPTGTYSYATTFIKNNCTFIQGNGSKLLFTGSGYGIIVGNTPQATVAEVTGGISDLWLQGPGTNLGSGLANFGLLVGGDPSGATPANFGAYAQNFYNLHIEGFATGVMFGRYSSLEAFHGGYIGGNGQGVWLPGNALGAGENYSFFGTVVNNNFTTGFELDMCGGEIKMYGGSIDYTGGVPGQPFYTAQKQAVQGGCVGFEAHGVHFEQYAGPIISVSGTNALASIVGGGLYTSGPTGTTDSTFVVVNGSSDSVVINGASVFSGHAMAGVVQWNDTGTNGTLNISDTTGPTFVPVLGTTTGIANWHVYSGNRLWGQKSWSADGTFGTGGLLVNGVPNALTQAAGGFQAGWNVASGSGTTDFYNNIGAGTAGGFQFFENDGGATPASIDFFGPTSTTIKGPLTVSNLTASTSPICANGVGGALTTTGCSGGTGTGGGGAGTVTSVAAPAASWPAWLTPTVTNGASAPSIAVAATAIPNAALANATINVNGTACALGGTCTAFSFATLPQQSNVVADYQLNDGSGTAPIDSSGNGNTGSFPVSPAAPTWTSQGLSCNGIAGGSGTTGQYFQTAGTTNAKSIMMVYTLNAPVGSNQPSYPYFYTLWQTPALSGLGLYSGSQTYGYQPAMSSNGGQVSTMDGSMVGTHVLIVVFGTGAGGSPVYDTYYLDGVLQPQTASPGVSFGKATAPFDVCGAPTGYATYMTGQVYRWTAWSTQLSANDAAAATGLTKTLAQTKGVNFAPFFNPTITQQAVFTGDSLTNGEGVTPFVNFISTNITYNEVNYGIGNITAQQNMSLLPFREKLAYAPNSNSNVSFIWNGTNDVATHGRTPQAAVSSILSECSLMHSFGFKTIVATTISRGSGNDAAAKNPINLLLRAQALNSCDALADFAGSPLVGADGANTNTTYYQGDATHLTVTGQQNVIAPIASHAIDQVTGSTLLNCDPAVVTGSTYTSVAADGCKVFNTASNSITDTLPSAVGYTNRVIRRCNNSLSGTNVVTIAAPSDTPFNNIAGSTTVTVPNNACKDFKGTLISPAAAGEYWQQLN